MRRVPFVQPALSWAEWWLDTALAVVVVAILWGLAGMPALILAGAGVGVQAGAAMRLWSAGGGGNG